ncbi:MAG: hydroxymethylbilane synthase [Planctomycetaceae bacterium]|jgi:hydroxymethylbilane synthase|nr:hydroxymethylbilane synthase [Planctomycetaceae bacterium]
MAKFHRLQLGSRGSALARWQADLCLDRLRSDGVAAATVVVKTSGDQIQNSPIAEIGKQGVFTKEIQHSLFRGDIDVAVHSLKDLPTENVEGLELSAVLRRGNHLDAFVCRTCKKLEDLPAGARIGTGSLRRKNQIINRYGNKFIIEDIRGNVETRLDKLDAGEFDAIILSAAGLERLDFGYRIRSLLEPPFFLPAVGQGAIALETRVGDQDTLSKIKPLNDKFTFKSVIAERAMLRRLCGGCMVPICGFCEVKYGELSLHGRILSMDGQKMIENIQTIPFDDDAESLGISVAETLINKGADKFLKEIHQHKTREK